MLERPETQLDFAIIGVQKAGTTALGLYLTQNPSVFLPDGKETHFFRRPIAPDGPKPRDPSHLDRHFTDCQPGQLKGDATPVYLYWPFALDLLKQHNPDLKLIISLRHPVLRAYSAWSMEYRRKRETLPFAEAIRDGRTRVTQAPYGVHPIYSYVERGFYADQLERLLAQFSRDQVFIMRNDQISASHPRLQELQMWLGCNPVKLTPVSENVQPGTLSPIASLQEDFDYLQTLYTEDMQRTAELTGLDLQDWLDKTPTVSRFTTA
ncbi:hypothetical protein RYZ27_01665 [Hyphomonas sp. FCG-A18]|uniref:sulfotransferase n=1 Tax=Hyphomonas sp. FCG-A18 TaxID=3080019 RepID=UPI002B30F4C5|nr:hypothetical protein RYZ27_01665 [Hyphomonas sp. FCG-A18]